MGTRNFTAGRVIVSIGVGLGVTDVPLTSCKDEVTSTGVVVLGISGFMLVTAGGAVMAGCPTRG